MHSVTLGQNETIIKNPTCTETGIMNATCDRCGDSQTNIEIPALGHDWDDGVVTVAPTCTRPGSKHFTCNTCGDEKDEVLFALGHAWDEGEVMVEPTCSSEGEKYHICANCGDVKTEKIEKTAPSKAPEASVPMRQMHGEAGFSLEKMKLSFLPAYL